MLDSGSFTFRKHILTQHPWLGRINNERSIFKTRWYLIAKRVMDLAFVLLAMPLVFPVLILCAILIKLEDPKGPILFIQPRTGKGG